LPTGNGSEQYESSVSGRLVKALGHPLRVQALQILNLRTASPDELASEMEVGASLLGYHLRVLSELECIELVRTEPVGGAAEHFYRATSHASFSQEEWGRVPRSVREAIESGVFDHGEDRHFSWTPMVVDRQGWEEVRILLNGDQDKLRAIQAASAERLADGGEKISIGALLSCFGVTAPEPTL
jgi:DNA-binding transcriptional ArsR family regulator